MLMARDSRPQHVDTLGRLCIEGSEVSSFLFQLPSDDEQAVRIREILTEVIVESRKTSHNELPKIATQLLEAATGTMSIAVADELVSGFDRMLRLWELSRSGLF
jgi:hypothetical protein